MSLYLGNTKIGGVGIIGNNNVSIEPWKTNECVIISTSTHLNKGTHDYDISEFIPNDNYQYEILLAIESTNGNMNVYTKSSTSIKYWFGSVDPIPKTNEWSRNYGSIILDANFRTIGFNVYEDEGVDIYFTSIKAYRKVTESSKHTNKSFIITNPSLTPSNNICTWDITHNLNTTNIVCALYKNNVEIQKNTTIVSANQITIAFNSSDAVTAESCKAVIFGCG